MYFQIRHDRSPETEEDIKEEGETGAQRHGRAKWLAASSHNEDPAPGRPAAASRGDEVITV